MIKKHLLDLVEAQLLGFYHCERGFGLEEIISSMRLTKEEWIEMKKNYDLTYMTKDDKKEIEECLK